MAAAPFLVLWMLCPLPGWWLNQTPRHLTAGKEMLVEDAAMLREVARQTWRYFAEFMGPETSWLPPDNFQVSPKAALALRTSPTNIGLGLLGIQAAYDFGFLTIDLVVERTRNTLATVHGTGTLQWPPFELVRHINLGTPGTALRLHGGQRQSSGQPLGAGDGPGGNPGGADHWAAMPVGAR